MKRCRGGRYVEQCVRGIGTGAQPDIENIEIAARVVLNQNVFFGILPALNFTKIERAGN
jgi:hypothetical protein